MLSVIFCEHMLKQITDRADLHLSIDLYFLWNYRRHCLSHASKVQQVHTQCCVSFTMYNPCDCNLIGHAHRMKNRQFCEVTNLSFVLCSICRLCMKRCNHTEAEMSILPVLGGLSVCGRMLCWTLSSSISLTAAAATSTHSSAIQCSSTGTQRRNLTGKKECHSCILKAPEYSWRYSGIRMASVVWHSFSTCSFFLLTIIFYMDASVQRAEDDVTPRLSFVYGKNNTQAHWNATDHNCMHYSPHLK